jgi:hypothetical protein
MEDDISIDKMIDEVLKERKVIKPKEEDTDFEFEEVSKEEIPFFPAQRLDTLTFKEEIIIKRINDMLKRTNRFSHKNALMYGIASSSTIYYKIVGILKTKGLIYFREGIPYIDKEKWNKFMVLYNQGKKGLFKEKTPEDYL